jgi:quinol-cytochrome oxidoreductase complex cytochrome b subunit
MHKVGSIRKASDGILRSVMNLVPDVATDGELLKISTKAIKDLLRVITKIGGITNLQIQDLPQDVVQDIEIGLQVHGLAICRISIKIHVLVLLHLNILILNELSSTTVITIETKQARESNKVDLIMLALRGPVDDVSGTGLVLLMMIGSIKLQDNLIIPMLPKLH